MFVFYSDLELCHRIKSEGWKIYQLPGCYVLHHRGVNRKNPSVVLIINGYRDELYYFKKWYPTSTVRIVKMIQIFELCLRMVKWGVVYIVSSARRSAMRDRWVGGFRLIEEIFSA